MGYHPCPHTTYCHWCCDHDWLWLIDYDWCCWCFVFLCLCLRLCDCVLVLRLCALVFLCFRFRLCLVVSILKDEFGVTTVSYFNSKKNLECLLILCCCLIPLLLLLYYLEYCIALFWSCLLFQPIYTTKYSSHTVCSDLLRNMRFLNRNFRVICH